MAYLTLAEVKSHLGITNADDDAEVQRALDAAEKWVDDFCHRTFAVADPATDSTTQRTYAPDHGLRLLWVDDLVDIDVLEKQTTAGGSWSTVSASDYELRPLNANADSEPYTHIVFTTAHSAHRFRVTGWFGWPALPDTIPQATLLQANFLYRRREAPLGISQVPGLEGGGMRVRTKGDPNAESMLLDYIRDRVLV